MLLCIQDHALIGIYQQWRVQTHEIDNEVKEILSDCYKIAKDILTKNLDALHSMSKALMDYETLDVDQIDDIMAGGEPRAPKSNEDSKPVNPDDGKKVGDAAEQS